VKIYKSILQDFALAGVIAVLMVIGACAVHRTIDNPNANAPQGNTAKDPANSESPSKESAADQQTTSREPSLVSISSGAFVVKRPQEWMDDTSAFHLLDENPKTMWASPRDVTTPQTIVIALSEKTLLKTLEFDNARIDSQFKGCSAKDITVEVSDTSDTDGFHKIADVSLKEETDNQRFSTFAELPGRWVRLTIKNNHGSDATIELDEFRGYGTQLTHTPVANVTGTYDTYFTKGLHLKQQGMSVTGCYESREGRVEGGFEGKAFKFTWYEKLGYSVVEMGPGIMVFSPDGKQMFSLWTGESRERLILGTKKSDDVGSCPNWAENVEQQLAKDLEEFGRARVYGINFDTDSDIIKDESKPTLDKIASMLKTSPEWKITIEGHTDSTSNAEHNQQLSERRAASVKNYLQGAGIDQSRLKTIGYGATKPLATNDTGLGRAQNRRVELAKQ
jgi:outer membrane protein OmpA-like peptidoglycan-associated protein